jgi:hypothetical protein
MNETTIASNEIQLSSLDFLNSSAVISNEIDALIIYSDEQQSTRRSYIILTKVSDEYDSKLHW